MKQSNLKKFRIAADKTQTEIANSLNITQPTYQRWEASNDASKIPAAKLKRLALLLNTTIPNILGEEDKSKFEMDADEIYYGEIAIHFLGGGAPLLIPISERERLHTLSMYQGGEEFIGIHSMDNRLIAVRKDAISDIYLSGDAMDEFGPESDKYEGISYPMKGDDFWQIIEDVECTEFLIEDGMDKELVHEALTYFRECTSKHQDMLTSRTSDLVWQTSNGVKRTEDIEEPTCLTELAGMDMDFGHGFKTITIDIAGYHRSIGINLTAVDYITVPIQMYNRVVWGDFEKEMEALDI